MPAASTEIRLPRPGSPAAAEQAYARWLKLDLGLPDRIAFSDRKIDSEQLLRGIFGSSPFLTEALLAEPHILLELAAAGPRQVFQKILDETVKGYAPNRAALMALLRRAKRRIALLTALVDLAGAWRLEEVTGALSAFADLALDLALALAAEEGVRRGEIGPLEDAPCGAVSGLIVLGMGKLGGGELNYSSDIDLIVLFDPGRFRAKAKDGPMALAIRLTRTLTYLLDHQSRDGYVFRTDLRLRPHPPGQPLALSTEDALLYYERFGQNWERAALIKARVAAGDREAGGVFLRRLRPFLWRRHLDYAAIRDIHSIKRQINAHRGHGTIRVLGHDLKVGRGGIREIEFFAQTQQLILGGRVPALRLRATEATLDALVHARWLEPETGADLKAAYRFLRHVEHRLQMVADKQTHRLPEREREFEAFAAFLGYDHGDALAADLRHHLETVERHYAALFESSINLGAGAALVFTGTEDDFETLRTLEQMGFARPKDLAATVRSWHRGDIRATRTQRARELLTELMPELLTSFASQGDPDDAFERFHRFIHALPAGVQLFSLFRANPRLLTLISDLMGTAPRIADHLSRHTGLFDTMLAPGFFDDLPKPIQLEQELEAELQAASQLEDALDRARRWGQEREFQVGVHILLGYCDGYAASRTLTAIAESVIRGLLPLVETWLAGQHGRLGSGSFAVLGLGKLGSGELTIGSDLDLIFVFDADLDEKSDGAKPLAPATYYTRLSQRLVRALTAQTAEGSLYQIDTRLRPSGNLGPVACTLANFEGYQMATAETWEHQALTRARIVAGDLALGERISAVIRRILTRPRDFENLAKDVRSMRERIFREHGDHDPWNIKHARGGLVEAEFIAQYLQLRYGHEYPDILATGTVDAIERTAGIGLRVLEDSRPLVRALKLYVRLQAVLRLSLDSRFDPTTAPFGLCQALVRAASKDPSLPIGLDIEGLERVLIAMQQTVSTLFDRLCPRPEPS